MKRKSPLRKFLTVELLVLLLSGAVSSFAFLNVPSSYSSSVTRHISHLALVSAVVLPWTISEGAETKKTEEKEVASGRALNVKSTSQSQPSAKGSSSSSRKPKQAGLPSKKTTTNNALLANIDFLTQLTNNKQASESEMDPLKCFPKALCGLSAESAAITRRRKNGPIQDYIRLMKAVSLNPSVMDNVLRKVKEEVAEASGQVQDDIEPGSDSEEDDEEYEEDEDDEEEDRKRSTVQKIHRRHIQIPPKLPAKKDKPKPTKKKVKKATLRNLIPTDSKEFTKMYLQERAHVERLLDDGLHNEESETTNWWAYENDKEDPRLEDLVDFSGSKLDSQSQEAYYTYGGKRKPQPPRAPEKPENIPEPKFPRTPNSLPSISPPPLPKPPKAPKIMQAQPSHDNSGSSTVGNFFRSLLGFSQAQTFTKDPFFEGFKRSMPDGTPTIVTVDRTKEILTTAIEIGETLRSPNQCNSLFNGCKYQYIELLHLIDDIRRSLSSKGKNDFITAEFFSGIEEYNQGVKEGSYGYKSNLHQTSQAETLSQDYKAAESHVAAKTPSTLKKKKRKNTSYRNGKMSSMSRENSVEIGSDEPTMYGSGQQHYDGYHQKNGHHHPPPPHHYNQQASPSQNNFQYDEYEMHMRQPKSIWATILSWFGFGR